MTVRVLDSTGKPLATTDRFGMVRHRLNSGEAVRVCRFPFTIRLLNKEVERVFAQPMKVGMDTGYKNVGISITTEKKELDSFEFRHRSHEVKKNLDERRVDRHGKRHRKTRYRKPRFNNRVKSKKKGWIPPSSQHMVASHVCDLEIALQNLPTQAIKEIHLELGRFDTQKMQNPGIEGEMYQQGDLTGFDNVKAFVRWRDGNLCQQCTGKSGDRRIEVHHIKRRADGGSDNPANLVCLCHSCHEKYHKGEIKLKKFNVGLNTAKSLRSVAAMNVTAERIFEEVKKRFPYAQIKKTYGYITRYNRVKNNIDKSHANDALVISKNFNAEPSNQLIVVKRIRRHNRQIHKKNPKKNGIRKRSQAGRYIKSYALNDYVSVDNKQKGFITARMSDGYATVKTIDGERVHEKTVVSMKRLTLIRRATNIIYEVRNKK